MSAHGYTDLFGARVGAIALDMTVDRSDRSIASRNRGCICVTGVHGVMEPCILKYSRWYADVLDWSLSGAFADKPHMRPGLLGGYVPTSRQTLLPALFIRRPTKHGTTFKSSTPKEVFVLQVVGTYTAPFSDLSSKKEQKLLSEVRDLKAHILWLGLSTPKQERFMAQYIDRLQVPLLVGGGVAFDFHIERIYDCSDWVTRPGLQSLHRLIQDLGHPWKRYVRNNPALIWNITLQALKLRQFPTSGEVDIFQAQENVGVADDVGACRI